MLADLKFVQGAVAKKDFLPAMTHFAIEKGTVRAYNGVIALCTPIDLNLECKPKADMFVHAISKCEEGVTPVLSMTKAGRLSIKSGKSGWFVDCVTEDTPHVWPEGKRCDFDGAAVLKAFETLQPFIGNDASRRWSTGVLLRGGSAYATNNVTLLEYWLGCDFPVTVNVPSVCIREMLRIGEVPTHAQLTDNSITFHYAENRWLRSQLLEIAWPDLDRILDLPSNAQPLHAKLFEGLQIISPFADAYGRVYMRDGKLSTVKLEGEGEQHSDYELDDFPHEAIFSIEKLKLLEGVATSIDFSTHPGPCAFFGERLRGAIIGMKL